MYAQKEGFFFHPFTFFPSKWDLANATGENAHACRETARTRGREKAGEGEKNVITAGNDNEVYILITRRVARWSRMQY